MTSLLKSFINSKRILRTELLSELQKRPCISTNIKNNCRLLAIKLFEFEIHQKVVEEEYICTLMWIKDLLHEVKLLVKKKKFK